MSNLNLAEEPGGLPDVTIVRVAGTFDIATLPKYEALLKRLRESGRVKLVVDLAGLDYVSSSGLGAFLGAVDPFRALGGDLVFVRLTDRVQKIFKVVGFTRLLSIAADEQEALSRFAPRPTAPEQLILGPATESPHSGEAFDLEVLAADARGMAFVGFNGEAALRASVGIVSPGKIGPFKSGVWHGKVVLTGPGPTTLNVTLAGGGVSGEVLLGVRQTKPPAVLPLTISCPGCGHGVEIHAFNVYRCKSCDETYFVDKWAHAISLKAGRRSVEPVSKRFTLSFPADVNLLGAARIFLVSVLKEQGYGADLINDIEMAADEAVTNVVEHAYQYDSRKAVHIEVRLDAGAVQVRIKDQGQAFDPLTAEPVNLDRHVEERRTGGLGVHLIQVLMDQVEYKREEGFNVLILTKKGGPA